MYIFELHLEIIRLRSSGICYLSGKTKNNLFLTAYIKTKKHKKCDKLRIPKLSILLFQNL